MDHTENTPVSARGVAELMVEARAQAKLLGQAAPVQYGDVMFALKPGGEISTTIQKELDERKPNPRDRRGKAVLTNLDSFIAHVNRFGDSDSVVFANSQTNDPFVLAVLDYHRADRLVEEGDADGSTVHGEYRHGRHRSSFRFPLSDEWQAWRAANGESMTMAEFAAFLENRVLDVAEVDKVPESAKRFVDMMGGKANIADWASLNKIARSLTVYENAVVENVVNLDSGALNFEVREGSETEVAGIKVSVPTMFFIDIPLFREGPKYRLPVRLRWRKPRGSITFFYEMWNPEHAFTDAFNEAIARIAAETPADVLYGSPEAT